MIRKAAAADLEALVRLVRTYYEFDGIDFDEAKVRPALDHLLRDGSVGAAWLVEIDGRIVGYTMGTWSYDVEFGGRFVMLTDLFVEASRRGAGFGKALLAAVEEYAREGKAGAIEGQVMRGNERARGFYHAWGFQFPDRLLMSRKL
jgi:GNAT superfamily N-acetyltransferase